MCVYVSVYVCVNIVSFHFIIYVNEKSTWLYHKPNPDEIHIYICVCVCHCVCVT